MQGAGGAEWHAQGQTPVTPVTERHRAHDVRVLQATHDDGLVVQGDLEVVARLLGQLEGCIDAHAPHISIAPARHQLKAAKLAQRPLSEVPLRSTVPSRQSALPEWCLCIHTLSPLHKGNDQVLLTSVQGQTVSRVPIAFSGDQSTLSFPSRSHCIATIELTVSVQVLKLIVPTGQEHKENPKVHCAGLRVNDAPQTTTTLKDGIKDGSGR